jgi:glycosidase
MAVVVAACGASPSPSPVGSSAPTGAASATASAAPASASASASPATPAPSLACTPSTTPAGFDWNSRVWYEAFVRSFSDSNGDGIGDFRGLTAKLDYLNDGNASSATDLGIGGLWLMPVFKAASYHGYDVIDYRTIDPAYGTSADFAAFVAAAHQRGIKVILDLVMNHTSDQNPWFLKSAAGDPQYKDWYVWSDTDPGFKGPQGQTVWHPLNGRYYYGVFGSGMPDLNLRNPAVTAELKDIAKFWLAQGVDGFRLDAIPYLIENGQKQFSTPDTLAWLRDFQASLKADNPDAMTIGEVWADSSIAAKYVPDSTDLTFDFDLAGATVASVQTGQPSTLASALGQTVSSWPTNQMGAFLTNHDQTRVMSQLGGNTDEAKLAAFLLMAEPGIPWVYYGEETGTQGTKPDEQIRTPMAWTADPKRGGFTTGTPWEPLAPGSKTANVATESSDPASLLNTYRSLIRLHEAQPALQSGGTVPVSATGTVVAWLRTTADDVQLVVANPSSQPASDYALTLASGPLCGAAPTASTIAAVNMDATTAASGPTLTPAGGFDGYRPFGTLPPRAAAVIDLGKP